MSLDEKLVSWFLTARRSFPWRENPTPYRVWISEVMLQQTRAQVVVPYFERWLELFPDISTLAGAPIDRVIKAWEGLGYYSRARNLHLGAQYIVDHFDGRLPSDFEKLLKIPGIGRYTAAAILSFGFKKRAVPVDGNVARVISRYSWIDQLVDSNAGRLLVEEKGDCLLHEDFPWLSAEALIELGATVCTPTKPRCEECPLRTGCIAAEKNQPEALPLLRPRPEITKLIRGIAIIEMDEMVLVKKNGSGQLMADLYEFPMFEDVQSGPALQKRASVWYGQELRFLAKLDVVTQSFTRYLARLYPFYFQAMAKCVPEGYEWVKRAQLKELPFSSGHRKILTKSGNLSALA